MKTTNRKITWANIKTAQLRAGEMSIFYWCQISNRTSTHRKSFLWLDFEMYNCKYKILIQIFKYQIFIIIEWLVTHIDIHSNHFIVLERSIESFGRAISTFYYKTMHTVINLHRWQCFFFYQLMQIKSNSFFTFLIHLS